MQLPATIIRNIPDHTKMFYFAENMKFIHYYAFFHFKVVIKSSILLHFFI